MEYELVEGQIVLCTVEKIVGTTVFVKIDGDGDGTITTSEIAPGRIRNLRDYVIPGKKIVCKIIKILGNKIHLSLRRVKLNEKKELLDKISREKSYTAILKTVSKDYKKILEEINKKFSIIDFFDELKEDPKILEEYFNKDESEKILKIIKSKKEKPKEIKHIFNLSNSSSSGIKIVKNILQDSIKNSKCDISYIAAGKYRISSLGKDFKEIKAEINNILSNIELQAKKQNCSFEMQK